MNRHTILPTLALLLAFSVQSLRAADKPSPTAPDDKSNPTAPGDASTEAFLDKKKEVRQKRLHHLEEKSANGEFKNSPDGIAFKNQLASLDQEINAVYEKYLNIFRESPATEKGKMMRAERDRQIQLLEQKKVKTEADYEKLKESSPAYQDMLKQHEKARLRKFNKQPLKPEEPEKPEGDK